MKLLIFTILASLAFTTPAYAVKVKRSQMKGLKHILRVYLNQNNKGQALIWFDHGSIRGGTPVSGAGIPGKYTPRGYYKVHNMDRNAYSAKFKSPMPCSFFFITGKYAVHGTTHVDHLGGPASNGCVRVDPQVICPIFDEITARGEQDSVGIEILESPEGLY